MNLLYFLLEFQWSFSGFPPPVLESMSLFCFFFSWAQLYGNVCSGGTAQRRQRVFGSQLGGFSISDFRHWKCLKKLGKDEQHQQELISLTLNTSGDAW